ncbi:putative regulator of telomere elongation helicase 1 [Cocos nucifera]|uniref:Regulator of telomere elongation helicase 1 homolog n=1 Tax=Cocos nucifera TaxID=13894 RepID=A0A8K0N273_COCNU|nr:putative regulator of telomere elongation helicase 1 [Cocos nucifera]
MPNYKIRGIDVDFPFEAYDCQIVYMEKVIQSLQEEGICADAASFDLPSGYLTACISEAKQCVDVCIARRAIEKSADKQHDPDNYAILRALLLKLEKRIAEVAIESKELGFTRPGNYIYEFLSDLNITYETANMLIDTIDNAALLLEEGKVSRTLSWWCFHPGLAMEEFIKLGVRSIILTSGTLSPLDSFALEFNLKFQVRLENPHVISPHQIWVGVVPSGPSGYPLNSSYRNRDLLEYKQELGNAIVNFARIVPDGLLVFFPSYYMMDQCIECWKNMGHSSSTDFSTIWDRICRTKQPVVEPRQSSLFPHAIEDFEAKLCDSTTSGAIFFAVCRGKVSEGLDFADQAGRAVVITGMPFSMKTDPKVRLKRQYLDQQALSQNKNSKVLTGEEWYVQQAARAVNQAVGRIIRHRHDYGAIIFCDERFAQQNRQCEMSYWLRPHIKCYPKFGDVVFTLTRFFREKGTCGTLKPKPAETLSIVKTRLPEQKISLPKTLPCLVSTAEHCSRKSLSSVLADLRSNIFNKLGQVVPANRSLLAHKANFHLTVQNSRESSLKESQCHDDEVVDLTSDARYREQPIEDASTPSIKKLRTSKIGSSAVDCECDEWLCTGHSRSSLENFSSSSRGGHGKEISGLSPYGSVNYGTYDKDICTQHGQFGSAMISNDEINADKTTEQPSREEEDIRSSSLPHDDKETRGSAFLMQVISKYLLINCSFYRF